MLWWLSVAPFGKPVVPLVYWMLMWSSNWRAAARSRSSPGATASAAPSSASQSGPSSRTARSRAGQRGATDLGIELFVGQPDALVAHHQRLPIRMRRDRPLEVGADGLAEQRRRRCAVRIGQLVHLRPPAREPSLAG